MCAVLCVGVGVGVCVGVRVRVCSECLDGLAQQCGKRPVRRNYLVGSEALKLKSTSASALN